MLDHECGLSCASASARGMTSVGKGSRALSWAAAASR
jgi:hypothetical protein